VIDIMQIHFGPEPGKVLDDGECVRAMKDAREAGEIRFLGASIGGELLDRCIDSGDFQVVQVGYSLLDTRDGERIRRARDRGIGVFIRGGLGGGWLTPRILTVAPEKRPAKAQELLDLCRGDAHVLYALALQFLAMNEGISSILVGTKRPESLREAVNLTSRPFDPEPLARAAQIAAA
jgi:aryl-alcohol dehydrogenase-like predicted oxidoreductase